MTQTSPHSWWRPTPPPSLTSPQKQWLMRAGALTQGLRALGHVELRVLREFSAGLTADESDGLHRSPRSPVWVREIAMRIDGRDAVVARSVALLSSTHGVWQGMRRLRTRPLADILYHDPAIRRSDFEVARVHSRMPMLCPVRQVLPLDLHSQFAPPLLLARRSVFWRAGDPLLVAECFLPAFWSLLADCAQH